MPRCLRCNVEFVRQSIDQIHCVRCAAEVVALIAADRRRRTARFVAKDLTGALVS